MSKYDVVIVGAGHAGCEAALAAHRLGAKTALFTLRLDRIAQMSCNPAIGGVGKSQLVKEIDALGGAMGKIADATGIQFRVLNQSRGPAVRSTRCQSDSDLYRKEMTRLVSNTLGDDLFEDEIVELLGKNNRLYGVRAKRLGKIDTNAVVITTGTFLNGLCHVGDENFEGGRIGDNLQKTYLAHLALLEYPLLALKPVLRQG